MRSRKDSMMPLERPTSRVTTYPDAGLSTFLGLRPRLVGIAYRMLGSATDAEDIVQDVWIRWQTADRSVVRDAAAFLVTATTRLAINVIQSARSRREAYIGPPVPELVDTSPDPASGVERREALLSGVLVLLQRLSRRERAAYILREAFDFAYRDIASVLRLEEANARQLVTRARQHVANGRRRPANSTEQRRLLDGFIAAAHSNDVAGLESLLAPVVSQRVTVSGPSLKGAGQTIAGTRPAPTDRTNTERDIDHDTRHPRRHRAHRIKAGHQAA
jgi:RNA polymerase sigma-70 factor (ECF subfamily)